MGVVENASPIEILVAAQLLQAHTAKWITNLRLETEAVLCPPLFLIRHDRH
jgi:hypothetical protein